MARAKVISQLVAGSQPSLSVTGRADGGGYTVTAGARSLSITAEAGATLSTTVTDQDNASITVTDSTSTTPSWTAPGGGTTGADYCVQVTATKGGYTSQVSWSELVDGSGGGGSASATEMGEISFLADMTAGSKTTTGAFTIYEADGTTPKATGQITTSGTLTASWTVEWNTSYGIRITGVAKGGGSSGSVIVALTPASSVFAGVDWATDDIVAQSVYGAGSIPTSGAIWYAMTPYGSLSLTVNDGRAIKATNTAGTMSWTTERWGNYSTATVAALGTTAIPSSAVYHQELRALGNRIKIGASDYIDPGSWRTTAWDGAGIGRMAIAADDDPEVERYAAAGGFTLILAANNNDAANPCSTTLQKAKFWRVDL